MKTQNMISRTVKVDRTRAPMEALKATGRAVCYQDKVVANMSKGEGNEVEVFFFKVDRMPTNEELEKEYGLRPADPYSLAAVNEDDPTFADEHPNITYWKDEEGKWCFAYFVRDLYGYRIVYVNSSDYVCFNSWWFAGIRK